jgi:hypothetical protein
MVESFMFTGQPSEPYLCGNFFLFSKKKEEKTWEGNQIVNVKYMFFKRKNNKNTLNYISDELVSNP